MLIKGFQKSTLLDYPGKIACTVFLFGCNFRCPYCFTGKSKILTDKGVISIEDIVEENINCKVFDFEGNFSNIKKNYKRRINKLLKIQFFLNSNQIECTPVHQFFVYDSSLKKIVKKEARKLNKETDYLVVPVIKKTIDYKLDTFKAIKNLYEKITTKKRFDNLDIIKKVKELRNSGVSWRQICKKLGLTDHIRRVIEKKDFLDKKILPVIKLRKGLVALKGANFYINNKISLSKDMMRLIGYYLSEGCVIKDKNRKNSYNICFTFNKKEKKFINDVSNIFKNLFKIELKKLENRKNNTVTLVSYKGIMGLLFHYYFGFSTHSKKLPMEFLYLDKELQKELIIGLFRGDGISSQNYIRKYQRQRIQLTSQTLLYQISLILWRLGIKHSIFRREIIIADKKIFDILDQENLVKKKIIDTSGRYGFLDENYAYLKINSVKKIEKNAHVYNLEMDNQSHSYNVGLIGVSNCHNPELIDSTPVTDTKIYTEEEIFQFLREHNKFLEGVCITGGEPTLNNDLPEFIRKIKRIGHYGVKLDTNGTNPEMLEILLKEKLADYVAMDFKAPLEKYKEAVNAKVDIEALKKSVNIIKRFPNYEFRITAVPKLTTKQDLLKIAWFLKENNANSLFTIQQFQPKKCLNKAFEKEKPYSEEQLKEFKEILKPYFKRVELRGID